MSVLREAASSTLKYKKKIIIHHTVDRKHILNQNCYFEAGL